MKKYLVHDTNGRLFATAERTICSKYTMNIHTLNTNTVIKIQFPHTPIRGDQALLQRMILNISDSGVIKDALNNYDLFVCEETCN